MALRTRANKIFIGVKDEISENRKQLSIISSLTSNNEVYLNQYAKVFTEDEIGSFDVKIAEGKGILEFYPIDGSINNYSYNFIIYDIKKYITETGSYDFGNCLSIVSESSNEILSGISTLFVIDENISSLKFLVEISSESSNNYEYIELNSIIKDSNSYFSEFGRITISDSSEIENIGLGTYGISNNNQVLELNFYPNIEEEFQYNLICTNIFNYNFNGTKKNQIRFADVKSVNISIPESGNPQQHVIASYTSDYIFGYFIVQVTDKTNNQIQLSEILLINNEIECSIVEYGNIYTSNPLGTFDCSTSTTTTELLFTPNKDIDIDITLLQHSTSSIPLSSVPQSLDLKNSEIISGLSKYNDSNGANLKKSFELTHKNIPIFKRRFDGGSLVSSQNRIGVDLTRSLISIPNNFFKTGEKVLYSSSVFDYVNILTTITTQTSSAGSNIIYINNTSGLNVGDFLNLNSDTKNEILEVASNYVTISNPLDYEILSGSFITFSRYSELSEDSTNSSSAIGIAQTYIVGVGITNKLSGDIYVYKLDNNYIGLCTSPLDALSNPPKLINFNSLGLGNKHYITATNQNSKCIISIDNIIQSPISYTPIKTTLVNDLMIEDNILYCSGITSFFSGDLVKIDDEIMKINYSSIGIGNSIIVERPFLGTGISTHLSGAEVRKIVGNYNIVDNNIHFASAPYGPIYDSINGDVNIRSSFQGRVFTRSGVSNLNTETYEKNYIFDDISNKFDAKTKQFKLTENGDNVSQFSELNAITLVNNIFQSPENDYNLSEELSETTLSFTGTATSALYDVNNSSLPRGGIIVSVGSSNGYGYHPLSVAGGTAVISGSGSIQSISIGNSGSGYRTSVQPLVRVGVQTLGKSTPNIEYIGTAVIQDGYVVDVNITNPGTGYDQLNPPKVIFDHPLPYSNLELKYYGNNSGIGSQAKIDIVVGQGSSVVDFTISNYGYSYKVGDVLTINSGGLDGIPIDTSKQFEPFTLTVEQVFTDNFSAWTVGELQKLDDIDYLFDGVRKRFPISNNGNRFGIISKNGSDIDLEAVLLIFINNVLQKPGVAYKFTGGSIIEFTEAPKLRSKCKILFYRGTPNIDVKNTDIEETIKVGDKLQIIGDKLSLVENERIVSDIILPDTLETLPYNSTGISSDNILRPVTWCKQKDDIVIDGVNIHKSRTNYESNVSPVCNIIQPVSIGQTQIYVDNVKSLFDPKNENTTNDVIGSIEIIENIHNYPAKATASVSSNGTIQSINIIDSGYGYKNIPEVSIQPPSSTGVGVATLTAEILSGGISNISIDYPGFGYSINPPLVLIEPPTVSTEYIEDVTYIGDSGFITGINTINVGSATTGLILDFYIPQDSLLKNVLVTDPEIINSQISQGYYFKLSNSNIGSGVKSLRSDGSVIGIGTIYIDNIYEVISVSIGTTDVYGIGSDTVAKVVVSIDSYNGISGFGYSSYYGDYTWGIINTNGVNKSYDIDKSYGIVGLNSTPIIRRLNKFRSKNYTDT